MRLIHYTDEKFSLEPRKYEQFDLSSYSKPKGLWVSVEGDCDWKSWCEVESYRLEGLKVSYEVKLKESANILHLKTSWEILEMFEKYPFKTRNRDLDYDTYNLNWKEIEDKFSGIIISPYQWNCRLSPKCSWYYGWDCASGCIWDLNCIEEFKLNE